VAGPPANGGVSCAPATSGPGGWLCQHRAAEGLVGLRTAAGTAPVTRWWSNGANAIAFAREGSAYVVVNREPTAVSRGFDTGLPAGTYCDLTRGRPRGNRCSGPTVTVGAGGILTTTVPGLTALAISTSARTRSANPAAAPAVTFHSYATVEPGQKLYVVGSAPELGAWDPARAVPLDGGHYPNWTVAVPLAPGTAFEYKYIRRTADGTVTWESRSNRTATLPADGWLSSADGWEAGATVSAAITLRVAADPGQSLLLVGSVAALGSWDPGSAVPLSPVDATTWSATVTLPGSQFIEYKYIRRDPDGGVVWESDPNRSTTTPSGGTVTLDDTWR